MSSISEKLTQKQQRFVDEYIISGNATQAAIKAGYSKRSAQQTGAENLLKPVIKAELDRRNAEIKSAKTADMQEVMEYLASVMRGEQTESVATAKGIYDNVPVSAKDRIKAAELIGKRHGAWTDKKEISGNMNIDIGMGTTMKIISVLSAVPVMLITGLLMKPGLVTKGVFITAIIVEFFMAFMASDYYADN